MAKTFQFFFVQTPFSSVFNKKSHSRMERAGTDGAFKKSYLRMERAGVDGVFAPKSYRRTCHDCACKVNTVQIQQTGHEHILRSQNWSHMVTEKVTCEKWSFGQTHYGADAQCIDRIMVKQKDMKCLRAVDARCIDTCVCAPCKCVFCFRW